MEQPLISLEELGQEDKLKLLELLLNDLHRSGVIGPAVLNTIAAEVMLLDYQEDEELLCFNCLDHDDIIEE